MRPHNGGTERTLPNGACIGMTSSSTLPSATLPQRLFAPCVAALRSDPAAARFPWPGAADPWWARVPPVLHWALILVAYWVFKRFFSSKP